jgi:sugar-specific transcriptional regulator TrmB
VEDFVTINRDELIKQWIDELKHELEELESTQKLLKQEVAELMYKKNIAVGAERYLKKSAHLENYIKKIRKPFEEQLNQKELELENFEKEYSERRAHITALLDELKEYQ